MKRVSWEEYKAWRLSQTKWSQWENWQEYKRGDFIFRKTCMFCGNALSVSYKDSPEAEVRVGDRVISKNSRVPQGLRGTVEEIKDPLFLNLSKRDNRRFITVEWELDPFLSKSRILTYSMSLEEILYPNCPELIKYLKKVKAEKRINNKKTAA